MTSLGDFMDPMMDFYAASQYFVPTIPFQYGVPTPLGGNCPESTLKELVPNPLFVFKIPNTHYGDDSCEPHVFEPNQPPEGCVNMWLIMEMTGILYFENVAVVPNKVHMIKGGWYLSALCLTSQK